MVWTCHVVDEHVAATDIRAFNQKVTLLPINVTYFKVLEIYYVAS